MSLYDAWKLDRNLVLFQNTFQNVYIQQTFEGGGGIYYDVEEKGALIHIYHKVPFPSRTTYRNQIFNRDNDTLAGRKDNKIHLYAWLISQIKFLSHIPLILILIN